MPWAPIGEVYRFAADDSPLPIDIEHEVTNGAGTYEISIVDEEGRGYRPQNDRVRILYRSILSHSALQRLAGC